MLNYKDPYGITHPITFELHEYIDGNLAIRMFTSIDGYREPYANLTVNATDYTLGNGFAAVDTNNLGKEIVKFIKDNELGIITGLYWKSGFWNYPIVNFNREKLEGFL